MKGPVAVQSLSFHYYSSQHVFGGKIGLRLQRSKFHKEQCVSKPGKWTQNRQACYPARGSTQALQGQSGVCVSSQALLKASESVLVSEWRVSDQCSWSRDSGEEKKLQDSRASQEQLAWGHETMSSWVKR